MSAIKQTFSCRYSIDWKSDMDSYFDIDPVEGTISTNELLDRESIAQHNISVVATKLSEWTAEFTIIPAGVIICVKDLIHLFLLQSILHPIFAERFIVDYKPRCLSLEECIFMKVFSSSSPFSSLPFSFLTTFLLKTHLMTLAPKQSVLCQSQLLPTRL